MYRQVVLWVCYHSPGDTSKHLSISGRAQWQTKSNVAGISGKLSLWAIFQPVAGPCMHELLHNSVSLVPWVQHLFIMWYSRSKPTESTSTKASSGTHLLGASLIGTYQRCREAGKLNGTASTLFLTWNSLEIFHQNSIWRTTEILGVTLKVWKKC